MTLHTLDELAARVGCSRRTVNRWVAEGRVQVVRLSPRMTRVTDQEIERVIQTAAAATLRDTTPDP